LLVALKMSGFEAISYASARAENAPHPLVLISVASLVLVSPVAVLWLSGALAIDEIPAMLWHQGMARRQRFILWFVLLPIAMCATAAFLADIRVLWLTPMFSLWGVYLIGNLPRRCEPEQAWRMAGIALLVNLVILVAYAGYYIVGNRHSERPLRWEDWPQQALTAALETRWREATHGAPLEIVGGPLHFAGAVAFWAHDEPSFFEDLNPVLSPWITPQRIAREGMLVVWEPGDINTGTLAPWLGSYHEQSLPLQWSDQPAARTVTLHYLIVPPEPGASNVPRS
jgi:hypothetical protein